MVPESPRQGQGKKGQGRSHDERGEVEGGEVKGVVSEGEGRAMRERRSGKQKSKMKRRVFSETGLVSESLSLPLPLSLSLTLTHSLGYTLLTSTECLSLILCLSPQTSSLEPRPDKEPHQLARQWEKQKQWRQQLSLTRGLSPGQGSSSSQGLLGRSRPNSHRGRQLSPEEQSVRSGRLDP